MAPGNADVLVERVTDGILFEQKSLERKRFTALLDVVYVLISVYVHVTFIFQQGCTINRQDSERHDDSTAMSVLKLKITMEVYATTSNVLFASVSNRSSHGVVTASKIEVLL